MVGPPPHGTPRLFKHIGSTWILNALQILVLMKLTPFVLDSLGREQNGVWLTIVSLTGVLGLLVLGVPMASVRFVAEQVARKDLARTNAAVSTCLGICMALGAAALVAGAGLYFFFDATYLPAGTAADGARIAFAVASLQVAAGFAMRLPYGILDAHGDFILCNLVMGGELLLRLSLTLGLLAWRASLPVLALVQVLCMAGEFALAWIVIRRRYPGLRFGLSAFDRSLARAVLGFSVFAMLLNVGTLLAFRADALVIGAHLGAEQVTFFDVGNKFFEPMTALLIAVGAVVMPTATRLRASGDEAGLRSMFLKWSKISASIVLLVGTYLLVLGPRFLGWWIGPDFVGPSGDVLQVLMLSFLAWLPVRGVALPVLMGVGRPARPALAFVAMGLVNLALSLVLVGPFGILGVAIGTALPNLVFAGVLLALACRELGVRPGEYLAHAALRPALGALAPLGILILLETRFQPEGIAALLLCGLASTAVFALTWVLFVYRGDPHLGRSPESGA